MPPYNSINPWSSAKASWREYLRGERGYGEPIPPQPTFDIPETQQPEEQDPGFFGRASDYLFGQTEEEKIYKTAQQTRLQTEQQRVQQGHITVDDSSFQYGKRLTPEQVGQGLALGKLSMQPVDPNDPNGSQHIFRTYDLNGQQSREVVPIARFNDNWDVVMNTYTKAMPTNMFVGTGSQQTQIPLTPEDFTQRARNLTAAELSEQGTEGFMAAALDIMKPVRSIMQMIYGAFDDKSILQGDIKHSYIGLPNSAYESNKMYGGLARDLGMAVGSGGTSGAALIARGVPIVRSIGAASAIGTATIPLPRAAG